MDNKEFSKELEKRTRKFALRIIRLSTALPNTPEGRVVRNQITKSGPAPWNTEVYSFGVKNNIWIEVIVEVKWLSCKKVNL